VRLGSNPTIRSINGGRPRAPLGPVRVEERVLGVGNAAVEASFATEADRALQTDASHQWVRAIGTRVARCL